MVCLNELEGLLPRANLRGNAIYFVIEDVAQALGKDEREDIVLVFWRVLGPADGAGSIPYPGFEGFVFGNRFSHTGVFFAAGSWLRLSVQILCPDCTEFNQYRKYK